MDYVLTFLVLLVIEAILLTFTISRKFKEWDEDNEGLYWTVTD